MRPLRANNGVEAVHEPDRRADVPPAPGGETGDRPVFPLSDSAWNLLQSAWYFGQCRSDHGDWRGQYRHSLGVIDAGGFRE